MSDLIDRQAVINKINERQRKLVYCFGFENDLAKIMNIAKSIIIAIPSAQPEDVARDIATIIENEKDMRVMLSQRWIPCSERLPEDLEEVNVTWVNHIPEPYYDFLKDNPFTGSAVYYRGEWFWYSSRCVDMLAEYGVNGMDKVDDGIEITAWMPLPEPYGGEE